MAFKMGGKKMVFDRGRYKEAGNKGSRSEKKGGGFIAAVKEQVKQNRRLKAEKKKAQQSKKAQMARRAGKGAASGGVKKVQAKEASLSDTLKEHRKQIKEASNY